MNTLQVVKSLTVSASAQQLKALRQLVHTHDAETYNVGSTMRIEASTMPQPILDLLGELPEGSWVLDHSDSERRFVRLGYTCYGYDVIIVKRFLGGY